MHGFFCLCHLIENNDVSVVRKLTNFKYLYMSMQQPKFKTKKS